MKNLIQAFKNVRTKAIYNRLVRLRLVKLWNLVNENNKHVFKLYREKFFLHIETKFKLIHWQAFRSFIFLRITVVLAGNQVFWHVQWYANKIIKKTYAWKSKYRQLKDSHFLKIDGNRYIILTVYQSKESFGLRYGTVLAYEDSNELDWRAKEKNKNSEN